MTNIKYRKKLDPEADIRLQMSPTISFPLQAWTGHEGCRRFRLPDFKTIGTWRWQGCQPYAPAAFTH